MSKRQNEALSPLVANVSGKTNGRICRTAMGPCVLCAKDSVCVCQRCGDFYCSPECQRRDWLNHRYICFPMPALVIASAEDDIDESFHASGTIPLLTANDINPQVKPQDLYVSTPKNHKNDKSKTHNNNESNGKQQQHSQQSFSNLQSYKFSKTISLPSPNSRVFLTGFRSPNRCYIRSIAPDDDNAYNMIVKQVDTYGKKAPPLTKVPKVNSYAITSNSGIMYRVQILSARSNSNIRILFCEFGTTAIRQLKELREISEELQALPHYAIMVQLHNVENYSKNENLMNFLGTFEDQEFEIRYDSKIKNTTGSVELFQCSNGKSMNDEIVKFCSQMNVYSVDSNQSNNKDTKNGNHKATDSNSPEYNKNGVSSNSAVDVANKFNQMKLNEVESSSCSSKSPAQSVIAHGPPKQIRKPIMIPPFETIKFKIGSPKFTAIVLDNSWVDYAYVGCIATENSLELGKTVEYFKSYEDNGQQYEPKNQEYCLAKYEGEWYRAKVVDIPQKNHYTVVYVDFTNEKMLNSQDIRRYPADLKYPCYTNFCLIDGLPSNLRPPQVEFLRKILSERETIVIDKVLEITDQYVRVESMAVVQKMHDAGFFD